MKKICLKLFSLQKIDKNKSFKKQLAEGFCKNVVLKNFYKIHLKTSGLEFFLIKYQAWGLQLYLKRDSNTSRRFLLFVICLTVSFYKEVLYICSNQTFFCQKNRQNSQFCYFFILQIPSLVSLVNVFFRSKYKHKKSYFVNEIVIVIFIK